MRKAIFSCLGGAIVLPTLLFAVAILLAPAIDARGGGDDPDEPWDLQQTGNECGCPPYIVTVDGEIWILSGCDLENGTCQYYLPRIPE